HAPRLVLVVPGRPARLHRAEAACPGARVAEDHDRRGALVPALPDVRAAGLLADGVEVQTAQQALQVVVVLARRDAGADPVRVSPEGRRAVNGGLRERSATEGDRQPGAGVVRVDAGSGPGSLR